MLIGEEGFGGQSQTYQDVVIFDPQPLGPLLAVASPARLGLGQPAELVPLGSLLRLLLLDGLFSPERKGEPSQQIGYRQVQSEAGRADLCQREQLERRLALGFVGVRELGPEAGHLNLERVGVGLENGVAFRYESRRRVSAQGQLGQSSWLFELRAR
jgi:hypothetical protein